MLLLLLLLDDDDAAELLNPAKEGTACILAEVLLVSTVASGQFKGGRPAGRWFLAAASANSNSSVRA